MKGILKLKNSIAINGNDISELKYDTEEISAALFAEADARRKSAAGMKNLTISPAAEFDTSLHLYLGFAAIVAANISEKPSYAFADVERIHGTDIIDVMGLGRNFILKSEQTNSPSNSSDAQSEPTAEPTLQA